MNKPKTAARLLRLTEKQNAYLKLKAKSFYDMSVQKYVVAVLFKNGWEKEYERLEKKFLENG